MSQQLIQDASKAYIRKDIPLIKVGNTIKVYQKIKEGNKERIQVFEGLVIAKKGGEGVSGTITVRKIVGGIGVEKIFPIHSTNIEKIEIIKEAKIRRSKLYFMRNRSGKSARLIEKHVSAKEQARLLKERMAEDEKEEVKAEEAPATEEANTDTPQEAEATPETKAEEATVDTPEETKEEAPTTDKAEKKDDADAKKA